MPKKLTKEYIKDVFEKIKTSDAEALALVNNLRLADQITLLNERDVFGWSILHWAIYENKDLLVKSLLDLYQSENIHIGIELRTGSGLMHGDETPLHIAIRYCHWRSTNVRDVLINLLINSGADVNSVDQNGMTALHWAAEKDCVDVINNLINNNNYEFVIKQNTKGNTALHVAVTHANHAAMEVLASYRQGALLNIQNHQHKTPLDLMMESQDNDVKNFANRLLRNAHQNNNSLREIINNRYLSMFQQMPNRTRTEKRRKAIEHSSEIVKKNKR